MQDALKNAESVVLSILISDGPRIIANMLFGVQISRSFRFMEEAVKKELSDIEGLDIRTVSDLTDFLLKVFPENFPVIVTIAERRDGRYGRLFFVV